VSEPAYENGLPSAATAAAMCKSVAFLISNPVEELPSWLRDVPSPIRQTLATWLRGEAIAFVHDDSRGSPYGFPSWHFASQVAKEIGR
jgi:hypothetical protein